MTETSISPQPGRTEMEAFASLDTLRFTRPWLTMHAVTGQATMAIHAGRLTLQFTSSAEASEFAAVFGQAAELLRAAGQ